MYRPNGISFYVPATNVHIPTPSIGEIVTFSFDNKSRHDIPTNPTIYRSRSDVVWDEVVYSFYKDNHNQALNGWFVAMHQIFTTINFNVGTSLVRDFKTLPVGYWNKKNMRMHMENFAKERNMDPLDQETWKNSYSALHKSPVRLLNICLFFNELQLFLIDWLVQYGKKILRKFKYRYYEAVKQLFPEIKYDAYSFHARM